MISYGRTIVTLLLVFCSGTKSVASPIPASELFRSPSDFSYKLNPSSEYLAHNFVRDDGVDVIEIVDLKNQTQGDIFTLSLKEYTTIEDYFWIDDDTMYILYRTDKNSEKKIFVDIDLKGFNSGSKKFVKTTEIKVDGQIIDPLKEQQNTFLFQKKRGNYVEVYKLTTKDLIAQIFEYRNRIRPSLSNAIAYFSDGNGDVRFGYTIDEKEVVYWYLNKESNDWLEIYRYGDNKSVFKPIGLIGDNNLAVVTNKESDLSVLREFNLQTRRFGKILYQNDKYDVISASIARDSREILSVSYIEHGRLMTQYFSDRDASANSAIKSLLPGKQFFTVSKNNGSSIKILLSFSSDDSGKFYWFNSDTKEIKPLNALYKNHKNYKFTKAQLLTVKNLQGQSIEAFLTKPDNGNGVLIVNPHGGPIGIRDNDDFDRTTQYFASRGYSVLTVNFRGSSGLGKDFMDAGRGQFGKKIESDITAVVNEVKSKYKFGYTCSLGASYGGYSALVLVAQNPQSYDCAVARYGIYDLSLLFNRSNVKLSERYISAITEVIGEQKDLTKDQSPIYFAEKVNVPVLLIAGKEDEISGFEQSNRMKYRLKQLNKDVETMFYSDTGHGYHTKWLWDWHEIAYIDDFIRRKLNLSIPNSKNWKKVIADEAMIISDGFEFKNKVEIDHNKAFHYIEIAASQDLPRAVHNLAAYYNNDEGIIKKDFNKALKLYDKASKLGWAQSSYYLYTVYKEGKDVEQDLKKSYTYLETAEKQSYKEAWFDILRAKCSGLGTDLDIDYCTTGLAQNDEKNHVLTLDQEKVLLEQILFRKWPSEKFKDRILRQLLNRNIHNLENKNDFVADSIDANGVGAEVGVFKNGRFHLERQGRQFNFKYFIKEHDSNNKKDFALKVKWVVLNKINKEILYESEHLHFANAGKNSWLVLDTSGKKFNVEGEVILDIRNLEDEVLFFDKTGFSLKEDS